MTNPQKTEDDIGLYTVNEADVCINSKKKLIDWIVIDCSAVYKRNCLQTERLVV